MNISFYSFVIFCGSNILLSFKIRRNNELEQKKKFLFELLKAK